MTGHGGKRKGAGRPVKWSLDVVIRVGQACEEKWRTASDAAARSALDALPGYEKIKSLHKGVQAIPISQRSSFLKSYNYEDHLDDLDGWLHAIAGSYFDENRAEYENSPTRLLLLPKKPPRGTRKNIIFDVSKDFGLSENIVKNLWALYRRMEKDWGRKPPS